MAKRGKRRGRRVKRRVRRGGLRMNAFTHKNSAVTYKTVVTGCNPLAYGTTLTGSNVYSFLFHYPGYYSLNGNTPTAVVIYSNKWAPTIPTTKLNSVFDDYRVVKMVVRVRTYVQGTATASLIAPGGTGFMDLIISHDADSYVSASMISVNLNDGACRTLPLMNGGGKQLKYITNYRQHTAVSPSTWFDTFNCIPPANNVTLTTLNALPAAIEPFASTQVTVPAPINFPNGAANLAIGDVEVKWYMEFRGENITR